MSWKTLRPSIAGGEVTDHFLDEFSNWCEDIGGVARVEDGKYEKEVHCETDDSLVIQKYPTAWVAEADDSEGVSGQPYYRRDGDTFKLRGSRPKNNTVNKFVTIDENFGMETRTSKKPDPRRHS